MLVGSYNPYHTNFIDAGEKKLIDLSLLVAALPSTPQLPEWSPGVGIIMTVFNIIGLIVARYAVQKPGVGPKMPFPIPGLSGKNFSLSQFLAGLSFGHILGVGTVLGLTNTGLL